ncbi:hypothetical protein BE221DRAFT_116290 [Ostreococcus tauri]|uniref:Uncharacterized protein n=1 Tax=Ostreococcus tauri TaxID=70448 RepID=A0A1Y5I7D5_OSTTA|nr:hypothetical protein BE221DRAFT_116290 [Ostreococcus tauri]
MIHYKRKTRARETAKRTRIEIQLRTTASRGTLRLRLILHDIGVTRVRDGQARHAVVSTARRSQVDVVCERNNTKHPSGFHPTPDASPRAFSASSPRTSGVVMHPRLGQHRVLFAINTNLLAPLRKVFSVDLYPSVYRPDRMTIVSRELMPSAAFFEPCFGAIFFLPRAPS